MQNAPLDPVQAIIFVIGLVTSLEFAQVVGPYAAIFVAGGAGAFLSITGNAAEMTARQAAAYVTVRIILAVLITVPLAKALATFGLAWLHPNITLIPLALGLGWVKDYDPVRAYIAGKINLLVTRQVGPKDGS